MQEFNSEQFNRVCQQRRQRIKRLPLNDQYSQSVTYQGHEYRYDPDYDCFYRVYKDSELSSWDRWAWIAVTVVLAALAFWVSP